MIIVGLLGRSSRHYYGIITLTTPRRQVGRRGWCLAPAINSYATIIRLKHSEWNNPTKEEFTGRAGE